MLPLDIDTFDSDVVNEDTLDALLDVMDEAEGRAQVSAARAALRLDAANLDAFVVLAEHAATPAEAFAFLREAIRIGNRRWASDGENEDVVWWWQTETRPYMRAILAYGNMLATSGRREQASECFRTLMEMQPNDSVGARFALEELNATLPVRRR